MDVKRLAVDYFKEAPTNIVLEVAFDKVTHFEVALEDTQGELLKNAALKASGVESSYSEQLETHLKNYFERLLSVLVVLDGKENFLIKSVPLWCFREFLQEREGKFFLYIPVGLFDMPKGSQIKVFFETFYMDEEKVSLALVSDIKTQQVPVFYFRTYHLNLASSAYLNFCEKVLFGFLKHINGGFYPMEAGVYKVPFKEAPKNLFSNLDASLGAVVYENNTGIPEQVNFDFMSQSYTLYLVGVKNVYTYATFGQMLGCVEKALQVLDTYRGFDFEQANLSMLLGKVPSVTALAALKEVILKSNFLVRGYGYNEDFNKPFQENLVEDYAT